MYIMAGQKNSFSDLDAVNPSPNNAEEIQLHIDDKLLFYKRNTSFRKDSQPGVYINIQTIKAALADVIKEKSPSSLITWSTTSES